MLYLLLDETFAKPDPSETSWSDDDSYLRNESNFSEGGEEVAVEDVEAVDEENVEQEEELESESEEGNLEEESENEEEEEAETEDEAENSELESNATDDEAIVVKEILKRREMSENVQTVEIDTTLAVDLKFNPAQMEVAIAYDDNIKLYNITEGVLTHYCTASFKKPLTAIIYSFTGANIFGVRDKLLYTFSKENDELTYTEKKIFAENVNTMDVGETCIVVGSEEGTIYVVNQDTSQLEFFVKVDEDPIECITLCNDLIYATSANQVYAVSMSKGVLEHQSEHNVDLTCGMVHGISFVTGSAKGELVLFSLNKLAFQGTYRVARSTSITCMTTISDSLIAVAFDNGTLKMYSLFPNAEVGIIGTLTTFATHISVSFDGKWLIANDSLHDCKLFSLADVEDAPPESKKRKCKNRTKHLESSSTENKEAFFSSL